jgi:glyoxalase family protein
VIFEIATDVPGFLIDEDEPALGAALKLPPQFESRRTEIEAALPPLEVRP